MKEVQEKKPSKRLAKLPAQKSANDTSNWENRDISAVTVNLELKKRIVRNLEFIKPKTDKLDAMTLKQIQRSKQESQTKKSE